MLNEERQRKQPMDGCFFFCSNMTNRKRQTRGKGDDVR